MLSSVRARLIVLLLGFLLLVSGSVAATFVGLQTTAKDALLINLAGRQRMLIQQMTTDALRVEQAGSEAYVPPLEETAHTFDQTLHALMDGGQVLYPRDRSVSIPPTRQPDIRARLEQLQVSWDTFHHSLDVIMAGGTTRPEFEQALQAIHRLSPDLVQQADDVVRQFEFVAEQKVVRLRWIQAVFFVSALALLVAGAVITQRSVVQPLHALGLVAGRIGQGDLGTPVEVTGPREIELLAHRFDTMREQLHTSQAELTAWTEELETRVAQRTRELATLYEVSREISSRLDIDHVLRSVTDKARELLGGQVAFLCLLDDQSQVLNLQAVSGPQETVCGACIPVEQAPADQVLVADRALSYGVDGCMGSCALIAPPFQVSHLAAPLRVGERVIGALCVGSPTADAFSSDAESLLTKLANSAAIALENARLYRQAERVATLEERERIAADMHDGLAQTLSYLHLKVDQVAEQAAAGQDSEALASLERVREMLVRAVDEVRANIAELSTLPSPPQTLSKLLTEAVQAAADGQTVHPIVAAPALEGVQVPPDVAEQIRRIVQEAVTNAGRHAEAHHVQVRLDEIDGEIVIAVEDDGRGFEPGQASADDRRHFGLSTMRARAVRIGGRLAVESTPGHGTRVTLRWPPDHGSNGSTDGEADSGIGG